MFIKMVYNFPLIKEAKHIHECAVRKLFLVLPAFNIVHIFSERNSPKAHFLNNRYYDGDVY